VPLEFAPHDAGPVDAMLPLSRSATAPPLTRSGATLRTDWLKPPDSYHGKRGAARSGQPDPTRVSTGPSRQSSLTQQPSGSRTSTGTLSVPWAGKRAQGEPLRGS